MEANERFLMQALDQAEVRRGFCAPNPAVGAVIVKNNQVIARGYHRAAGEPHAEVVALNQCGDEARGATLYVTLEPCCHTGKTPPCTNLIIERGIETVIYGYRDPNPIISGRGHEILEAASIKVNHFSLPAIEKFYESYQYWVETSRPFVTAKIGMSLDGKITGPDHKTLMITNKELQEITHQFRKKSDAILTTINTVLHDNPQLNVRLGEEQYAKPVYVLDSHCKMPMSSNLLKTAERLVIFHGDDINKTQHAQLKELGVVFKQVPSDSRGLSLSIVLNEIGKEGIHDLWVEAGSECFQSLIEQAFAQRILIYIAPQVIDTSAKPAFNRNLTHLEEAKSIEWQQVGTNVICDMRF